jgi:hypothetical protein
MPKPTSRLQATLLVLPTSVPPTAWRLAHLHLRPTDHPASSPPTSPAAQPAPTRVYAVLANEVHPERLEQVLGLLPCYLIQCILRQGREGTRAGQMARKGD